MYATKVIEAAIAKYEAKSDHRLIRIANDRRDGWRAHLDKRLADSGGEEAQVKLSQEERLFIRNERVLCMLDWRYWSHWAVIQRDGGGTCSFDHPWESTEIILKFIAKIEEEMHDHVAKGEMTPYSMAGQPKPAVPGILVVLNKSRQLGATATGRVITMHRLTTQRDRRALAASVDDDKIQEMYDRDKLIYDNLPWWLKPPIQYDTKAASITLGDVNSRILYQVSSQKSGIGVGRQIDIHHLTELSTWLNPSAVELDFFPTIPRSLATFGLEESTPYGRGNWWHEWTEKVRKGHSDRWRYLYVPWYAELSKYRTNVPEGWQPSEAALLHAQKVADTSTQYVGHRVLLPATNLRWWEVTREEYRKSNRLNFFLTNWSATPEESFQHSTASAFDSELLADLRDRTRQGTPYEIGLVQ